MSTDDRDQAGGHPIRHPHLLDCGCCKAYSIHDRCAPRTVQRVRAITEQFDDVDEESNDVFDDHVFIAGRCLRCRVNSIDASIYDQLRDCPGKSNDAPLIYSTAKAVPPSSGSLSRTHLGTPHPKPMTRPQTSDPTNLC